MTEMQVFKLVHRAMVRLDRDLAKHAITDEDWSREADSLSKYAALWRQASTV
jgi:hypothetical protein